MTRKFIPTIISVSVVAFALLAMPIQVSAGTGVITIPNISRYENLEDLLNAIFSLIRFLVVIILIVAMMIGGFTRMTSQGDPDKIARSQKIIVSALIGFAIIILAPVIVEFAGRLFGAQDGIFDVLGGTR